MIHERKPNRMKGYDYSKDNLYFVTTCVHDRVCCFGNIHVGPGRVDDFGPGRDDDFGTGRVFDVGTGRDLSLHRKIMVFNEYGQIAEKQWHWLGEQYHFIVLHAFVVMPNHFHGIIEIHREAICENEEIKIKSLSELMGAYKTTVSKQIHLLGYSNFAWQRSFYDHIIRDDRSYENISNYILNNPLKWEEDKFYNQ